MSVLLKEIRRMDPEAAKVLEQAKFCNDSEIQTLTREDLHELLPGAHKLKLRRDIFETIHKQKPIQKLLTELQAFIPQEAFRAALTSHGVLVDYLHILKDMKTQLNNVQSFLDAHVDLLENLSNDGSEQQGQGSFGSGHSYMQKPNISGATSSASVSTSTGFFSFFGLGRPENTTVEDLSHADKSQHKMQNLYKLTQDTGRHSWSRFDTTPQIRQVNYKMVISGKTFDAHLQILDRIQGSTQQLNLVNMDKNLASKDCHVTFVFCPVVSRVGTDVEAAMKEVKGSGPVIVVMMHHSHEAKHVPSCKTWDNGSDKDIDYQNVFYHEKFSGLIPCKENEDTISAIRNYLLNHFGK